MTKKSAAGTGTIRKKTVTRNGKPYTFWEARYTAGYDPGTGKQLQRSISGKTQKEVAKRLKEAVAALDAGTYLPPNRLTVGEWLDIWARDYLGGVKPYTVISYRGVISNHLKPALGALRLEALSAHTIQHFYNGLSQPTADRPALSAKTVKNIHGVLHRALQQAVRLGYLRANPADACALPRIVRREIRPLDEDESRAFLAAARGHPMEALFTVVLFTGLREGEALGLGWEDVDFSAGVLHIRRQLQREKHRGGQYVFAPLKNDRSRQITPAPWVMKLLRTHRVRQKEMRLRAGPFWEDSGLVFTDDRGRHLATATVYGNFKRLAAAIGRPDARFHDLRHSYAVAAIRSGDDIKTVQGNLGHATAAFTLDVYGHVTDQMRQESARRMERYIQAVLPGKSP